MKLRFEVDQAACFRAGIDCPNSIVSVDVDPGTLTQQERNLIADRMRGIDVFRASSPFGEDDKRTVSDARIVASTPTFEGLLEAIRSDEKEIVARALDFKNTMARAKEIASRPLIQSGV